MHGIGSSCNSSYLNDRSANKAGAGSTEGTDYDDPRSTNNSAEQNSLVSGAEGQRTAGKGEEEYGTQNTR